MYIKFQEVKGMAKKQKTSTTQHHELHNEEAYLLIADEARQQGRREEYLEFSRKYNIDIGVSEEDYNVYLEAKRQYEENHSIQYLNRLIAVTKDLIQ